MKNRLRLRRSASLRLLPLFATLALPAALRADVDRDRIEDADFTKTVTIVFDGSSATVSGADAAGVTVTRGATDSRVAIASSVSGIQYVLSGASPAGYLQLSSANRAKIVLDGVSLASPDGPALSVLGSERTFLVLPEGKTNTLADSATYSRTGKGTVHTGGKLLVSGPGSLSIASLGGHGINSDKDLRVLGGHLAVTAAAKDALHPKNAFRLDAGSLDLAATGDGIDAAESISLAGGRVSFVSSVADVKALKTDGAFTMSGGTVTATLSGDQSKAVSAATGVSISGGALFLDLSGGVVLESVTATDGSTYSDPSYCTAIKCDGDVSISGGHLVVTHSGTAGKGVSAGGAVSISDGVLDFSLGGGASASYIDDTGATDTAAADAITADGTLAITGGAFTIELLGDSADGLSSDTLVDIDGGTFAIKASGNRTKGLKSKDAMRLDGGSFTFAMSGNVVLEQIPSTTRHDPSYCTAIKCDGALAVTGGTFVITHSGTAGKGVSVDGDIVMSGGSFTITNSGAASATFVNASGATDRAAADCFKSDANLTITGGTLSATATGAGGDAISCDGAAVIGILGVDTTPVVTARTSGARQLVSGSDYINCKAFKAGGNLTFNGGRYTASTSTEGGEGLESKAHLVINGGTLEITTYDDGINAASSITVNGGNIYCYASNNDGIDSNGTMTFNGGVVVSSGYNAPEEGFDCDQNTFKITGGTLVGTGGATSSPTASVSTQRSVIYKGAGTANVILQVKSASGDNLVYRLPRTYSGGGFGGPGGGGSSSTPMTLLFSNPGLVAGTTYSIVSGATVSGGTEFHGLVTGATVTGGTTLKTFTPTAMVTTVQ